MTTAQGERGMVHVLPINDLREHDETTRCWCLPTLDDLGIVVHNSMDRREEYERGRLKS